jgi:hypothetical protein
VVYGGPPSGGMGSNPVTGGAGGMSGRDNAGQGGVGIGGAPPVVGGAAGSGVGGETGKAGSGSGGA